MGQGRSILGESTIHFTLFFSILETKCGHGGGEKEMMIRDVSR